MVDNEFEIFGQRINASGGQVGANDFRISDMGTNGSINFAAFRPAVAYSGSANEYLVVWHGQDNTAPLVEREQEIFGQRISNLGAALGANDFRISDMGPNGDTAYAASNAAVAYNSTNNEFLVVWQGDDNTGGLIDNEFEIFGQRLSQPASAAAIAAAAARPAQPEVAYHVQVPVETQRRDQRSGSAPTIWLLVIQFSAAQRRVHSRYATPAPDCSANLDMFFSWRSAQEAGEERSTSLSSLLVGMTLGWR